MSRAENRSTTAENRSTTAAFRDALRLAFARGAPNGGVSPRPHQIRAVGRVLRALDERERAPRATDVSSGAADGGGAVNYLLQHSAGSGKSFTIACLAAVLVGAVRVVTPSSVQRALPASPRFDLVVVLSDRIQLDEQLGSVVERFLLGNGWPVHRVARPRTVAELRDALARAGAAACAPDQARAGTSVAGTVIVATLQKFPMLTPRGGGTGSGLPADMFDALVAGRLRTALIADEAHRSHGAASTEMMHTLLGGRDEQLRSVTYFGFTATPSDAALRLFGVPSEDVAAHKIAGSDGEDDEKADDLDAIISKGELHAATAGGGVGGKSERPTIYRPFDVYSMEAAVRDGFVLDVLGDYETVSPHIEITSDNAAPSSRGGDRLRDEEASARVQALAEAASNHREVVRRKAAHIVAHLRAALIRLATVDGFGSARAMLVARSRKHVVWYVEEMRRLVEEETGAQMNAAASPPGGPTTSRIEEINHIRVYGAFSGEVTGAHAAGVSLTETSLNGSLSADAADVLVVCSKYETGFDDPRLAIMYVDKPLRGARAVQTLGRLARPGPKELNKRSPPAVVDFVNTPEAIRDAFEEFYGAAELRTGADERRRRLHAVMDRALSRLLAILLPVVAAAGEGTSDGLLQIGASRADGAATLGTLTAKKAAAALLRRRPESRSAAEESIGAYCDACEKLRRERPELPYPWAAALRARLAKMKGVGDGGCGAPGRGRVDIDEDGAGGDCEDEDPTTTGTAQMKVNVRALERTFRGRIMLQACDPESMPYAVAVALSQPMTSCRRSRGVGERSAGAKGGGDLDKGASRGAGTNRNGQGKGYDTGGEDPGRLPLAAAIAAANDRLVSGGGGAAAVALNHLRRQIEAAVDRGDTVSLIALLRRLQFRPVTVALLTETKVGITVTSLKSHRDAEVAATARALVKRWKSLVRDYTERKRKRGEDEVPINTSPVAVPWTVRDKNVVDEVRTKAAKMLRDAVDNHWRVEPSDQDGTTDLTSTALSIESALAIAVSSGEGGSRTGAGYRSRLRALAAALGRKENAETVIRLREIARQSRAGSRFAGEVGRSALTDAAAAIVAMDRVALASESVRATIEARERRREREAEVEARGGAAVEEGLVCPSCCATPGRCVRHHFMSGGTYAEERQMVESLTCLDCGNKWRTHDARDDKAF